MTDAIYTQSLTACQRRNRLRILLVDDQEMVSEAVRHLLSQQTDVDFFYTSEGAAAVQLALKLQPTIILQDLVMRDADGLTLIPKYKETPELQGVPVIVLSVNEDPGLKARCFAAGVDDYMVKLPDKLEFLARLRYHANSYLRQREIDVAFQLLRESEQNLAKANIALQKLAMLDGLTGIPNRRRFDETIAAEWNRCRRDQAALSLLLCDIDGFKGYNDHFGHPMGDQVLRKTASTLAAQLRRPADLVARYGGEEFIILLPDTLLIDAVSVARGCCRQIALLQILNPHAPREGVVTVSIGVATTTPNNDGSSQVLINRADRAMYAAKAAGRNCIAVDRSDETGL